MTTQLVHYTNTEGIEEIRRVPDGLQPSDYSKGIFVGPPDLTEAGLTRRQRQALSRALIDAGLLTHKDLVGKRARLFNIIKSLFDLSDVDAKAMRNRVLVIYQRESIPDKGM